MANSLRSAPTSAVLQRLLHEDQEHDPRAFAAVGPIAEIWDLDTAARAETFKTVYMSVSADGGDLLYLLARATGARTVVESGTSFGGSAIYLASAVRDNGGGLVVGTELQPEKAAAAREAFAAADVAELIDLREGDARTTLSEVPDTVDLVLLDGWPDLALPVLRVLEPALRTGTLILVDDVDMDFGRNVHGELLTYLTDPSNGYLSVKLPVGDGMQAAVRL